MYGKSSNVIDERCEDLQFLCWMKNIVKTNSYVMIKFSTKIFMIVIELKKKLLEKHTLEAVFSMPDELFLNSKIHVV